MEIEDVGDIFNPQYLINWERPDPKALFDNSWEPIEQDQEMLEQFRNKLESVLNVLDEP
jgi:hypothetical protein